MNSKKLLLAAVVATITFAMSADGLQLINDADACGFKVVTIRRGARYREVNRAPKKAAKPRPAVAAKPKPRPVAARSKPVASGPKRAPTEPKKLKRQMPEEPVAAPAPEEPEPVAEPEPEPEPKVTAKPKKVTGKLNGEVFFATGSADLTAASRKRLKRAANWLKAHPDVSVVVEGHSDSRGSPDLNMDLSERRANAARDALVEFGVDESRLSVQGFGSDSPKYKALSKNRRATLTIQ